MSFAVRRHRQAGCSSGALRLPLVIVTYHLSYGIGSLIGWWDVLRHGVGRARFGVLSR